MVVGWGLSTGGYWAAKVAHTHAEYFAGDAPMTCATVWLGPVISIEMTYIYNLP
jgi:hypothetical protein